ncbi:9697_t:CDS:10 [Ambispora leptoticha]|uniref:Autophagy-related protein 11 n=1 Tax=Ambispora leptoticha TaxID=144679 RepID=A0A9N8W126_9GLOM|nr:9697_t:CDS:10 [Ambispora leptoticha]
MKFFRAETGKRLAVRKSIDGFDALKTELETISGVPIASQILMTDFGMEFAPDMMAEATQAEGKDEYIIFLFNRELLDASIKNFDFLSENPVLETPIIASAAARKNSIKSRRSRENVNPTEECGEYIKLFQALNVQGQSYVRSAGTHAEICERLYQEQRRQLMALGVALKNLDSHNRSIAEVHREFYTNADKEISKINRIINSVPENFELMRRITIHPELLNYMERDSANTKFSQQIPYALINFVDVDELSALAKKGHEVFEHLSKQIVDLNQNVRLVQEGTEKLQNKTFDGHFPSMETTLQKVRELFDSIKKFSDLLERDLERVKAKAANLLNNSSSGSLSSTVIKTVESFEQLAYIHANEYIPEMEKKDQNIREHVKKFTWWKNTFTVTLISNLQEISKLESSLAQIPAMLTELDTQVRDRGQDYKRLLDVYQIPLAYGMTIVEIVRRREYTRLLLEKSHVVAEVMAHFRDKEQKRRDAYRLELKKHIPFNLPGWHIPLDDNPPSCEISMPNIRDDRLPKVSRDDIQALLDLISQISPSHTSQRPISQSTKSVRQSQAPDDPSLELKNRLIKSFGQLEGMNAEFQRIVEKQFFNDKKDGFTSIISSRTPYISLSPAEQLSLVGRREKRVTRQTVSENDTSSNNNNLNMDLLLLEKMRELEGAEEKLKAYESRIKSLENTLQTNFKASKSATLPNSDPSLEKALATAQEELSNLKSTHADILKEKDVLERKTKDIEMHFREMETQHGQLFKDKGELETRYNDSVKEKDELETRYKDSVKEKEILQSRISDLEKNQQEMTDLVEELKKDNEMLSKKAIEMEQRSQNLEASLTEVCKDKQDYENMYFDTLREKEAIEKQKELLEKQCHDIYKENNNNQKTFQDFETYIEELEFKSSSEIASLKEEHEKYKEEAKQTEASLREKIHNLEANLAQAEHIRVLYEEADAESRKINENFEIIKNGLEQQLADLHNNTQIMKEGFDQQYDKLHEEHETVKKELTDKLKKLEERYEKLLYESKEMLARNLNEYETHRDQLYAEIDLLKLKVKTESEIEAQTREKLKMIQEELIKTQERVGQLEDDLMNSELQREQLDKVSRLLRAENTNYQAALQKNDQLVKEITESILQNLPTVVSNIGSSSDSEQIMPSSNINPIKLIRKLGIALNQLNREFQEQRQLLENTCKSYDELKTDMEERTFYSHLLSRELWEYYSHIRTLMSDMQVAIPINLNIKPPFEKTTELSDDERSKTPEQTLSDSYLAEDLNQFFNDPNNDNEKRDLENEWPKDKYELLITLAQKVDLEEVRDLLRRSPKEAESLARKYQKGYKTYKEKHIKALAEARDKIAFRNFKVGDLALFLPTRNSTAKPWAAFNISFPHYFLRTNDSINSQTKEREWIVSRITGMAEHVVDKSDPTSNPFDLPNGVKFYLLDVENLENFPQQIGSHYRRRTDSMNIRDSQIMSMSAIKPMSSSISNLASSTSSLIDDQFSTRSLDFRSKSSSKKTTDCLAQQQPLRTSNTDNTFTNVDNDDINNTPPTPPKRRSFTFIDALTRSVLRSSPPADEETTENSKFTFL